METRKPTPIRTTIGTRQGKPNGKTRKTQESCSISEKIKPPPLKNLFYVYTFALRLQEMVRSYLLEFKPE